MLDYFFTCYFIEASFMESSHEEFKSDDGVDDDDEKNQEGDIDEGNDGHEDGVHDDLKTGNSRDQSQWSEDTKGSECFHVKSLNLQYCQDLTDHTENKEVLRRTYIEPKYLTQS